MKEPMWMMMMMGALSVGMWSFLQKGCLEKGERDCHSSILEKKLGKNLIQIEY